MSDYAPSLPLDAKERYKEKLIALKCSVDPYIDSFDSPFPLQPVILIPTSTRDFLVNSYSAHSSQRENALKSLDPYQTLCSEGWLSTLRVKEWPNAVVLKCDIKPSQTSESLYRTS